MDKLTHEMRLAQWTPIIQECRASRISVRKWCSQNQVNEKQFYYWQRRIRQEAHASLVKKEETSLMFAPLPAASSSESLSSQVAVTFHYGDLKIEISNHACQPLLSLVGQVLSHVK